MSETPDPDRAPGRILIAAMVPADIDALLDIERASQPAPWSRDQLLEEAARAWSRVDVARSPRGQVIGFMNHWLVADEVQLHNLAVHPAHRRHGVADRLMHHLVAFARERGCALINLEVRAGNHAARALYRKHGFQVVGVRKGYYAAQGEDAVVMNLGL